LPTALKGAGVEHRNIQEMIYVNTIYDRLAEFDKADAYIVLPGGIGTLAELTNVIAHKQLGIYKKPIIIVNVDGFFDGLLSFYKNAVKANTMKPEHLSLFVVVDNVENLIQALNLPSAGFLHEETRWWEK
jgi:uncharacterized protein (TIGR00730 family)